MTNSNIQFELKASEKFEVGAILVDSWGWEQTNVDFYVIIKRVGLFVTIAKLKKETVKAMDHKTMTSYCKPSTEIDSSENPIRKKVKAFSGKETGFTLRDYMGGGWVDLWKGETESETHYA